MIRKYNSLLPEYLNGQNINTHADIIDTEDLATNNRIELLQTWNVLERPILFERVQEESGTCTINVHINSPSAIQSINITGDEEISEEYAEEELLTEKTYTFTVTDTNDPILPSLSVRVETYDDLMFEKAYPENDEEKGDLHDHDRFLDIIGSLLGVSRRKYKAFAPNKLPDTHPSYFAKFDSNGVMIPGTEDDWYYKERLEYFISHFSTVTLQELLMKILYEWNIIHTYNIYNRTTSLIADYTGYFYMITTEDREAPSNIDDTQRQEVIQLYDQLTRPSVVAYTRGSLFYTQGLWNGYANNCLVGYLLTLEDGTTFIENAPIYVNIAGKGGSKNGTVFYSDSSLYDSEYEMYMLRTGGLLPGNYNLVMNYWGEYEIIANQTQSTCSVNVLEDLLINDLSSWQYAKFNRTTSTVFNPPRVVDGSMMSMGRGNLVWTPVLYLLFAEGEDAVTITTRFIYGGKYTNLGYGAINHVNQDAVDFKDKGLYINPYSLLGEEGYGVEHTYSITIENGYVSTYLDDTFLNIQNVWIAEEDTYRQEMFYLIGYANMNETDSNRTGLYITEANITLDDERLSTSISHTVTQYIARNVTIECTVSSDETVDEGSVQLIVDNNILDTLQVTNGTVTFANKDISAGNHNIQLKYSGGENFRASREDFTLNVIKCETELSVETVNSSYGSAEIQATLTSYLIEVDGATITCRDGSTTVATAVTDLTGVATLDLSSLAVGTYTLTVEYAGDSTYRSTSTTHTINISNIPVASNLYGKGQSTAWSSTQWSKIEINAAAEAHCNYLQHPAILKNLQLSGDFILRLHIQVSHNQSWDWGLVPNNSTVSDPAMIVQKGDTLNGSSIASMFHTSGVIWDSTETVTVTRIGNQYTLEYGNNTYTFTGTTNPLYFYMNKNGSGNIFMTYIETSATMQ